MGVNMQIQVNHKAIEAQAGEMLLDALKRAGIRVPTLCHLEHLFPSGACRMCVVELEGQGRLVPSCACPVTEGMKVLTHSPVALNARKTILELLLASHPDDCFYCSRNGDCQLRHLSDELGVDRRRFQGLKNDGKLDLSSPSIARDPDKCILCGKCVRVCEEVQGVSALDFIGRGSKTKVATAFDEGLNVSSCVNCGQCVAVCPTGALVEKSSIREVLAALQDPNKVVVIQHAPAVSVSIGEAFGVKLGTDMAGIMVAALRKIGFARVFDTSFSADLTIMEEASELVHRIQNGGVLPMMTSCSPAWVKFVEQFYPELLPNLSTCKSPQQMMGAIIKNYWAKRENIDRAKVYSVSIMPCTAKKFEAQRPEIGADGVPDIDAVLTTRELVKLIRMRGLDLADLEPEEADNPFGTRSSAGKIFGASGGVMEAALRTAHRMLTGENPKQLEFTGVRGLDRVKEMRVKIGDAEIGVAVASGLMGARKLMDRLRKGDTSLQFIEVMSCAGGCVNGGGQPRTVDGGPVRARLQALYKIDKDAALRTSHDNPEIQRIYQEFLGQPLGHESHRLLHTKYRRREVLA
jgi:NADH-quinone oxidoreductase subunit G/NADP-reducing hydrogenase subunit HndD